MRRISYWLIFWIIMGLTGLHADLLVFKNGDRLSGTLVEQSAGTIIFENPILGRVMVSTNDAEVIVDPAPKTDVARTGVPGPTQPSAGPSPAAPTAEGETPAVAARPARQPGQIQEKVKSIAENKGLDRESAEELAQEVGEAVEEEQQFVIDAAMNQMLVDNPAIRLIKRFYPLGDWTTRIAMGYRLLLDGLSKEDINVNYAAEKSPTDRTNYRLTLNYNYGAQEDAEGNQIKNRDRLQTQFRYRYEFTDRYFLQNLVEYLQDDVKGISHDLNENLGIGVRILDRERWRFSVTPSAGVQYKSTMDTGEEWQAIVGFFQDQEIQISNRLTFHQETNFRVSPGETDDYSLDFVARLEQDLSENLNLNLRYEFNYDSITDNEATRDQQNIAITLGIEF